MPPRRPDPYHNDPEAHERPMSEKADSLALIDYRLTSIQEHVNRIDAKLERSYVTQDQLEPIRQTVGLLRTIVFGMVGLILVAVVGAIIALVVRPVS